MSLISSKLAQAVTLLQGSNLDAWITFVRETGEAGDPVLPFLIKGGMTWQSAFIVFKSGKKVAIVGNYDADPLIAAGHWDEVIPYVQGIREPLLNCLNSTLNAQRAIIGLNFSTNDDKADGLTHGMYLLLQDYLADTNYELVSAEQVVTRLRSLKTDEEIRRIRRAIEETDVIFKRLEQQQLVGKSEKHIYDLVQGWIDEKCYGYGWARTGNPIVNSGPDSMIGHGIPSDKITVEPGHIFHIDLGIIVDGYSSDIQRCWYVPHPGETELPADVQRGLQAVTGAISAGADRLEPGVEGWQVDEAARTYLVDQGYEEYMHALGHQVGRVAHDGGALLGPRWERYGNSPTTPIQPNEVYTLELGVILPGRGYLGLEDIVRVTDDGIEWLSKRQVDMPCIG